MKETGQPRIGRDVMIADTARIVADVLVGDYCNIWYGAVLRGDVAAIEIGQSVSVQENVVIHSMHGFPVRVGDEVIIGHGAILHGCTVGDRAMIGMGAIVLDGAEVGAGAMVGAGAVVAPGTVVPPGMLALGSPARVVRELKPEECQHIANAAAGYRELAEQLRGNKGVAG